GSVCGGTCRARAERHRGHHERHARCRACGRTRMRPRQERLEQRAGQAWVSPGENEWELRPKSYNITDEKNTRAGFYTVRAIIIFLISAMAFAGFRPFGQVLAQFMMVWQR